MDTLLLFASMAVPSKKLALFYFGRSHEADKALWENPPRIMSSYRYRMIPFGVAVMRNNFTYDVMEDTMSKLTQGGIPRVRIKVLLIE